MTEPRTRQRPLAPSKVQDAAAAADGLPAIASALDVTTAALSRAIAQRTKVRQAYERGRLVWNVRRLSMVGSSYAEAASALGQTPADFERLIGADPELMSVWRDARVNGLLVLNAPLLREARAGSVSAIKTAIERFTADAGPTGTNLRALRVAETATAFGVSRQSIHQWTRRGCPRNADGTLPLAELIAWRIEDIVRQRGVETPERSADHRIRQARAETAEMDLAQRRGSLLDRQSVIVGMVARVYRFVSVLAGQPASLAGELQGKPPAKIVEILEGRFAEWRRMMLPDVSRLKLPPPIERELIGFLLRLAQLEPADREAPS